VHSCALFIKHLVTILQNLHSSRVTFVCSEFCIHKALQRRDISVNVKAMSFSLEIQKYKAEQPMVLKIRYQIVCSCNPIFDSLIDFL
jgi:hypothetical protein